MNKTKKPDMMNDNEIKTMGVCKWVTAYANHISNSFVNDTEAGIASELVEKIYDFIKFEDEFLESEYAEHYRHDGKYLIAYDIFSVENNAVVVSNLISEIEYFKKS